MNETIDRLCREASDEKLVEMFAWYLNLAPAAERESFSSMIQREPAPERKAFIKLFSTV